MFFFVGGRAHFRFFRVIFLLLRECFFLFFLSPRVCFFFLPRVVFPLLFLAPRFFVLAPSFCFPFFCFFWFSEYIFACTHTRIHVYIHIRSLFLAQAQALRYDQLHPGCVSVFQRDGSRSRGNRGQGGPDRGHSIWFWHLGPHSSRSGQITQHPLHQFRKRRNS